MPAKIAIITYSMYGHIDQLAEVVEIGVKSTGATVARFQLPETLPDEVLTKMHAPPKKSYPVLNNVEDLKEFDGFLLGFPTRYGRAPAQVSTFFDKTGGLWMTGALVGKFAGIFTSTAGQHGGHETTALTTLPFLAHHGIIFVPIGYANPNLNDNSELLGGAPWGASTIAGGDGSRQPHHKELDIATFQGQEFAKVLNRYVAGKLKESGGGSSLITGRIQPEGLTERSEDDQQRKKNPRVTTVGNVEGYGIEDENNNNNNNINDDDGKKKKKEKEKGSGKDDQVKKVGFFRRLTLSCGGGQENYET